MGAVADLSITHRPDNPRKNPPQLSPITILRITVALGALLYFVHAAMHAQVVSADMGQRIEKLEDWRMTIEHRLTLVEGIAEEIQWAMRAILGAVGTLLLETIIRLLKNVFGNRGGSSGGDGQHHHHYYQPPAPSNERNPISNPGVPSPFAG